MSHPKSQTAVYDGFQHLVLSVLPQNSGSHFMALVTVYFDDSGTDNNSEIAVAGCFVSDVKRWKKLGTKWREVLREAGIEEGFRMSKFVAKAPPFDDWAEDKRNAVIASLVGLINQYALKGMAAAVIKKDYDEVIKGKLREKLGRYHYTFAVQACLSFIEQWWSEQPETQPVDYVFDQMSQGKHEIIDLFDDIKGRNTALAFGLDGGSYAFADHRHVVQLQASDILAWEARNHIAKHQFSGKEPRRSFKSIVDKVGIRARFYAAEHLHQIAAHLTPRYEALMWEGPLGGFLNERN